MLTRWTLTAALVESRAGGGQPCSLTLLALSSGRPMLFRTLPMFCFFVSATWIALFHPLRPVCPCSLGSDPISSQGPPRCLSPHYFCPYLSCSSILQSLPTFRDPHYMSGLPH